MIEHPESAPIDAFRACPGGVYDDGVVRVVRVPAQPDIRLDGTVLTHGLRAGDVDNDLAGRLAALEGADPALFERLFTGIVLTSAGEPLEAWTGFYRTTLDRLKAGDPGSSSIAEFAPIYRFARALVRGHRVLDLASCFGFLPVMLADDGHEVIASDLSGGSMRLLSTVDGRVRCLCCRAEALPLPDGSVDTVLVLHLLEHVDGRTASRVLGESLRVARLRVVVAVPCEDEPTPAYGHVRTLDRGDLQAMGEQTGLRFEVVDRDGGWLVLDHP